jgi:hypothetical protein
MSIRKAPLLITLLAMIGSWLLYLNRDSFTRPPIQISHRFHAFSARFGNQKSTVPVLFEFNRQLKLTSITVIPVLDPGAKKTPQPLWHLVSRSGSVPTKGFVYGMDVPGMQPAVRGAPPEPLFPAVLYRLIIEEGSRKAQHDFSIDGPSS